MWEGLKWRAADTQEMVSNLHFLAYFTFFLEILTSTLFFSFSPVFHSHYVKSALVGLGLGACVSWVESDWVRSNQNKYVSGHLIGYWIGCLTNEIKEGAISFSVKNLRKPTVLIDTLIGSNWSRDQPKIINISVRLTQYKYPLYWAVQHNK